MLQKSVQTFETSANLCYNGYRTNDIFSEFVRMDIFAQTVQKANAIKIGVSVSVKVRPLRSLSRIEANEIEGIILRNDLIHLKKERK
jgi:hypothetical protein